jgi:hypothetical protein
LEASDVTHQKVLYALKATHAKELDEAHDRAITAREADHATELEQLQASHAKTIASLKKEHAASQESLSAVAETRKVSDSRLLFCQVQLLIPELGCGRGACRRDHQDKRGPQKDASGT